MAADPVSNFRYKTVGAVMGMLWSAVFCLFYYMDLAPVPLDSAVGKVAIAATFIAAVVWFPMVAKPYCKSARAAWHLGLGGLAVIVPLSAALSLHWLSSLSWP